MHAATASIASGAQTGLAPSLAPPRLARRGQQRARGIARATGTKEKPPQAPAARAPISPDGRAHQWGSSLLSGGGVELGPIGLTIGRSAPDNPAVDARGPSLLSGGGVELGPIGLTIGKSAPDNPAADASGQAAPIPSIHSMTTSEWRAAYEQDGMVDLWVEEEFNAGSRLVGGRVAHFGGQFGVGTGEGPSLGAPVHRVVIHNHHQNEVLEVEVPEDRYILWEAEDNGLQLPYACRMGCCTACAVRVKEGEMYQPAALGISKELKDQGYALMCVGLPNTDLVLETVPEDEVYRLQFAELFARQALDPNNADHVERDDYALSIANMDE